MIFAFILALPVLLYELYGFLLPAFSPEQQRVATPLMLAIPFLFVIGVLFGYFVVLPAAVRFFQNFNSGQFNVLVQASQYYHFAAVILLAMGLVFQVPVAILAATRAGIVTTDPAAPQPPLRDRRVRRGRGVPAGRRDHAAAGDGPAVPAVRAERAARQGDRPAREAPCCARWRLIALSVGLAAAPVAGGGAVIAVIRMGLGAVTMSEMFKPLRSSKDRSAAGLRRARGRGAHAARLRGPGRRVRGYL